MWDEQHASNLRAFLSTATGLSLLQELIDARPPNTGVGMEQYALGAAKRDGWEEEFEKIEELSRHKDSLEASTPYIDTTPLDR